MFSEKKETQKNKINNNDRKTCTTLIWLIYQWSRSESSPKNVKNKE